MGYSIYSVSEGGIVTNMSPSYIRQKEVKGQRVTKEVKAPVESKVDDVEAFRLEYESLAGKKPHHLWKEARLKEEIAKLKD